MVPPVLITSTLASSEDGEATGSADSNELQPDDSFLLRREYGGTFRGGLASVPSVSSSDGMDKARARDVRSLQLALESAMSAWGSGAPVLLAL